MLLAIDPLNWESWLPKWMTDGTSGTEFFLNLGYFGYNVFYVLSIILFVFKMGQAFYNYQRKASTSMDFQKTELINEMWEPVKGLAYLVVGMSAVKIVVNIFSWSTSISVDDTSKINEVINVFNTIGVWGSISRIINITANVIGIAMACYCLFKALMQSVAASKEENPNQFSTKRSTAIQYCIYAGVSSCFTVIINVIFGLLGVGNIFTGFH